MRIGLRVKSLVFVPFTSQDYSLDHQIGRLNLRPTIGLCVRTNASVHAVAPEYYAAVC